MTEQFAIDSSVAVEMLRARTPLPAEMLSGSSHFLSPVSFSLVHSRLAGQRCI